MSKIMLEMVMIIQVMAGKIQYTVRNEDGFEGYSIGQEGVMNERRYERTMYACFIDISYRLL